MPVRRRAPAQLTLSLTVLLGCSLEPMALPSGTAGDAGAAPCEGEHCTRSASACDEHAIVHARALGLRELGTGWRRAVDLEATSSPATVTFTGTYEWQGAGPVAVDIQGPATARTWISNAGGDAIVRGPMTLPGSVEHRITAAADRAVLLAGVVTVEAARAGEHERHFPAQPVQQAVPADPPAICEPPIRCSTWQPIAGAIAGPYESVGGRMVELSAAQVTEDPDVQVNTRVETSTDGVTWTSGRGYEVWGAPGGVTSLQVARVAEVRGSNWLRLVQRYRSTGGRVAQLSTAGSLRVLPREPCTRWFLQSAVDVFDVDREDPTCPTTWRCTRWSPIDGSVVGPVTVTRASQALVTITAVYNWDGADDTYDGPAIRHRVRRSTDGVVFEGVAGLPAGFIHNAGSPHVRRALIDVEPGTYWFDLEHRFERMQALRVSRLSMGGAVRVAILR